MIDQVETFTQVDFNSSNLFIIFQSAYDCIGVLEHGLHSVFTLLKSKLFCVQKFDFNIPSKADDFLFLHFLRAASTSLILRSVTYMEASLLFSSGDLLTWSIPFSLSNFRLQLRSKCWIHLLFLLISSQFQNLFSILMSSISFVSSFLYYFSHFPKFINL